MAMRHVLMSADDITDIHICGACRSEFHNVDLFLLHKRLSCPAVLQSAVTGSVPSHKDGVAINNSDNQQQIPVSKDNSSMVTTSLGASMGIQVQSSGLTVVQDSTMGTSHPGEREGVRSTFMITPPQGHEYIQTNQRQALVQTNNQNKSESQIILTEKGELLVVLTTPPDGTEPNEAEINQQDQAMLNFIQYIRANGSGTTNVAGPILPNLLPTTEGMVHPSSAPIVQLGQNGSVSIMSTPGSQSLTVCSSDLHNGNLVDQTSQRNLIENPPQVTFDQGNQLDGDDPDIRPVVQAQDLAQQAARLSGVVESDLQSVSMETNTQQSDLDTMQYSVNVVNINQSANTEGVGQILQIPESNIQEENIVFSDNLGQPLPDSNKFGKFNGKTVIARGAKTHCSSSKNSSKSSSVTKATGSPNKSPGAPHKVRTPPVKKFKCHYDDDKCTFSSAYLKDLERHFRTHTGEKPFSCKYCERSFSRVDKLHLHMRAHTGDKPYKCKFCNYSAVDSSSLRKHAIVHTDERPHKCQVCPYACRTASQLTVHLRTHTGDSPFPCPFCPAKFKIKSDLRRHLRVHTGEKPYQCEKCNAKCATKGNLASHNRVHHSSENQMKCTVCDFSTSSKRSYKEHIKGHEPDDPDCVCHVCQYKCSNREVLRTHLSRHEKEKSYSCMHCYFSTNHKANLTLHIKRRHMQNEPKVVNTKGRRTKSSEVKVSGSSGKFAKVFTCHLCPESFVRKDSLRSHIRLHEEMANSTLTTALTVLKLQQPVINISSSGGQNRVAPVSDEGILDGSSDIDPKGQEQVMMPYGTDSATSANDRDENGRYEDGTCNGPSQSQSREGHSEVTQELVRGQDRLEYHREELHHQNMNMMNLQAPELSQIVSSSYNTSTQRVQTSLDSTVITLDMRTLSSDDITIVEPQGIAEARKMLLHRQVHNLQQKRATQDKGDDLSNQQIYRQLRVSNTDVPCDVQIRNTSETTNTYYPSSHITKRETIERQDSGTDSDGYRREMYTTSSLEQNGSGASGNLLETENPRCVLQNVMECPETSVSDRVHFQPQTIPSIQLVQNISFPVIRQPAGLIIPSVNGQSLNQLVGGTIQPGDLTTLPHGEVNTLPPGDVTTIQPGDSTTLPQSIHSRQLKGTLQHESINAMQPKDVNSLQQGDITVIQQKGIATLQQTKGTNPLSLNAHLQDGDTHLTLPIQILPQQTGNQSFQMIGGVSQLMNTAPTSVQLVLPTTVDNNSATGQKVMATSIRQIENPIQPNTISGIPHELTSSMISGQELNASSGQLSEVATVTISSNQTQARSCIDDIDGLMGQKVNSLNKRAIIPMSVSQTGGLVINSPLESHTLLTGNPVSSIPVVSQTLQAANIVPTSTVVTQILQAGGPRPVPTSSVVSKTLQTRNLYPSLPAGPQMLSTSLVSISPVVQQALPTGNQASLSPMVSQTVSLVPACTSPVVSQPESLVSPVNGTQDLVSIPVNFIRVPHIETSPALPDQHTKAARCPRN